MYCRQKGRTPRQVKHWTAIPHVPVDAFKELPLSSSPLSEATAVFMTSGSTSGIPGKHYHRTLDVYDLSMKINFKEHVMNEADNIRMAILFPTEETLSNSSLAHYLALAKQEFGLVESDYYIDDHGLQYRRIFNMLEEIERNNEPILILGASYSFVHLFDRMQEERKSCVLPPGSMIFDTGGYKNQSEELSLDEFYDCLQMYFGIPRKNCINMYGMTELSTQFYSLSHETIPALKVSPHWIRTRVINPLTEEEKKVGEQGILVHYDLANINSVIAIMTEDIGVKAEQGFYLLGRAEGAEAKGCSLALDTFVKAAKGDGQNNGN